MTERTILLVDDSPDDQMLVLRAAKKAGLRARIIVANDGEEAVRYLERALHSGGNGFPCVVFLDLKMPKMDGTQTLRFLRAHERLRYIPIVVFTSSNEHRDIHASYAAGASSFIRKPVDSDEFAETVRILGRYWTELNEPPREGRHVLGQRFSY